MKIILERILATEYYSDLTDEQIIEELRGNDDIWQCAQIRIERGGAE